MTARIKVNLFWILLILAIAFLIRLYNFQFPFFTSDEARVAYRGYALAVYGRDELGRPFPFIFNSRDDYQLPATSYVTAVGMLLFGKNDFGARIPFTLISITMIILVYQTSKIFNPAKEYQFLTVLIAAFSPALIFFSKIPNETILLSFGLILLFYLLTRKTVNLLSLGITVVFMLTTSKIAWWILVPFVVFTLKFFQRNLQKRARINIIATTLFLTVTSVVIFLQIPQSTRSLLENDFSILQDTSIKVVLDRLRGQGLEAGWPNLFEKIIFNKLQYITAGFINWLSHLDLTILFSQFDKRGILGFMGMGSFSKILLIPFVIGIISTVRKDNLQLKAVMFYLLILTFPVIFIYPRENLGIVLIVLPFLIFTIASGLTGLRRSLKYLIIILMIVEVSVNVFNSSTEAKNASIARPNWVKPVIDMGYNLSQSNKVAISDNIVSDITPFLQWLSPVEIKDYSKSTQYPYKFRQTEMANIQMIGNDNNFYFCVFDKPTYVLVSKRDFEKIEKWLSIDTPKSVLKKFNDDFGHEVAYLLKPTICVH